MGHQYRSLEVPNNFNLLDSPIRTYIFGTGTVDDINLSGPAFTTTLLHLNSENVVTALTTIHCLLEWDGRFRVPPLAMPSMNEKISFASELLSVRNDEIILAVYQIGNGLFGAMQPSTSPAQYLSSSFRKLAYYMTQIMFLVRGSQR
jgi:hypothetical protein